MPDVSQNSFWINISSASDEQVDMFHKDISVMEQRYQGELIPAMSAGFCKGKTNSFIRGKHNVMRIEFWAIPAHFSNVCTHFSVSITFLNHSVEL
jgi:hypothetical protein